MRLKRVFPAVRWLQPVHPASGSGEGETRITSSAAALTSALHPEPRGQANESGDTTARYLVRLEGEQDHGWHGVLAADNLRAIGLASPSYVLGGAH